MTQDSFARLDQKAVVVTGASRGIGRAIAVELARAGAGHIVVHYAHHRQGAEETADQIRALGVESTTISSDFSQPEAPQAFAGQVLESIGAVDVLINNAGVDLLTGEAAEWDFTDKLRALFDVDVRATALLSRHFGADMAARQGGVIINIGWDQADRGMEGDSGELFAAAKNAVMGLTRSLSLSLAPQVRVNCVAPGWIRTAWGETAGEKWQQRVMAETPLRRWGAPQDIAAVCRFLASPDASYLTGQILNANGGAVR